MIMRPLTATDTVLVTPHPLVLSMLHAGATTRLPTIVARSGEDFMACVLHQPPRVCVVGRGSLSVVDMRRLALRRAFCATPRIVLVLGRDEQPTAAESRFYDAVIVAGELFTRDARRLQALVAHTPARAVA